MSTVELDVVSFGTAYSYDLTEFWLKPAAEKCGFDLKEYSIYDPGIRTFKTLGQYAQWAEQIRNGTNEWDLRQVMDEACFIDGGEQVFAEYPDRNIPTIPDHLQFARTVPADQFAYLVAWRKDILGEDAMPSWADFFDVKNIPGKRCVRYMPHGQIEVALLAMGRDVQNELYDPSLTKEQIEKQVDDALAMFDRFGTDVAWWGASYQSHKPLVEGEVVMGAVWNRRVLRASEDLSPGVLPEDSLLQANPATAVVVTDWWLIPKGPRQDQANELLICMLTDKDVLKSAAKWCELQYNLIPADYMPIENDFLRHHLEMGSYKNAQRALDVDPRFWGKNFTWITERWNKWIKAKRQQESIKHRKY